MNRTKKGFTLIELLIVVAIIGIIVAIAIPNLLNAIQRAKQKRTMADMRSIGTATEAYAVDFNSYPPSAGCAVAGNAMQGKVDRYLTPTYIKTLPYKDGWDHDFLFNTSTNGQEYTIGSYGKDGATGPNSTCGATTDFNADIVFSNGQFTQWPEGVQN